MSIQLLLFLLSLHGGLSLVTSVSQLTVCPDDQVLCNQGSVFQIDGNSQSRNNLTIGNETFVLSLTTGLEIGIGACYTFYTSYPTCEKTFCATINFIIPMDFCCSGSYSTGANTAWTSQQTGCVETTCTSFHQYKYFIDGSQLGLVCSPGDNPLLNLTLTVTASDGSFITLTQGQTNSVNDVKFTLDYSNNKPQSLPSGKKIVYTSTKSVLAANVQDNACEAPDKVGALGPLIGFHICLQEVFKSLACAGECYNYHWDEFIESPENIYFTPIPGTNPDSDYLQLLR